MDANNTTNKSVDLFRERFTFWSQKGLTGAKTWEALAGDDKLPVFLHPTEAAEIAGLTVHALKARRARRMAPAYVAVSCKSVRYPTGDFCRWLGGRFQGGANA